MSAQKVQGLLVFQEKGVCLQIILYGSIDTSPHVFHIPPAILLEVHAPAKLSGYDWLKHSLRFKYNYTVQ